MFVVSPEDREILLSRVMPCYEDEGENLFNVIEFNAAVILGGKKPNEGDFAPYHILIDTKSLKYWNSGTVDQQADIICRYLDNFQDIEGETIDMALKSFKVLSVDEMDELFLTIRQEPEMEEEFTLIYIRPEFVEEEPIVDRFMSFVIPYTAQDLEDTYKAFMNAGLDLVVSHVDFHYLASPIAEMGVAETCMDFGRVVHCMDHIFNGADIESEVNLSLHQDEILKAIYHEVVGPIPSRNTQEGRRKMA